MFPFQLQIFKTITGPRAGTAVIDVDVTNLLLNSAGAFALLASAAATIKYMQIKRKPNKPQAVKKGQ